MREFAVRIIFLLLLTTFVSDVVNIQFVASIELSEELLDSDESGDDFDKEHKFFKEDLFAAYRVKSSEDSLPNKRAFKQLLTVCYAKPIIELLSPPPEVLV